MDNNLSDEVLLLEIVAWWKWDIPTGALSWSDEIYRILGFDKDNFHPTCQGWRDLIYRDDLVLFDAAIDDCLRCRRPFDCELGIVRPDGAGRTLHVRGLVIFDEAGNPLRIIGTAQDITEKKQAETGLHELGAIVKSSEDAILAKTLNGIITRWNRGAEKIYGYTESEVIGKSTSILVPEGHHNEVPELLRRVARGESVAHYETVRRCKDGREIQVCLTISPIYDLSGRITGASTVARDITERNRIQQRLRESEERFRQLTENIGEVFWLAENDMQSTIYASPAYETIWGRSVESLCTQPRAWLDSIYPEDREWVVEWRKAHKDVICETEYRIVRPDGEVRWIRDLAFPVYDAAGRIVRRAGVGEDVTKRKQTEEKLLESEERFRQLTENINVVFWLANINPFMAAYVSPAYEAIWGRTRESYYANPKAWLESIHPEDQGRVAELAATHKPEESLELSYRIVRPDGAIRWIRDRAFPVYDATGKVIRMAGVAEDITERRQLEMQLHQAQKMDAIGQLAAGVAHDFNNLLTVISGHSELLAMASPLDEAAWHESISEIRRATQLGSTSIHQLLAFSCRLILEPKVLDMNLVVIEAKKMLRRLIGENVSLITLLQPHLSPVLADPGQLNQVLLNLVVNARDAMPQGGSLTLGTREVNLDGASQAQLNLRHGRYVVLEVTDTGWGMAPDVQARIFEPFFTNKPEGRGSGLGLSVVQGIIQQSGGSIEVESSQGVGTRFTIYLPAAEGSAEGLTQRGSSKPAGGGETILLAEDEEPVRNITSRLLRTLGYQVLEAENGQKALELFSSHRGKIDLLFTDVVMPDLSGRQVAEMLRAQDPDLLVLFQSGHTEDTVVRQGIFSAEVSFLKKPYTIEALARKIREMLDKPAVL